MRESHLYNTYLEPRLKLWGDVCRVENTVDSGMPDVNYVVDGTHGWLELKISHSGIYHFERFQLAWLRRRYRHNKQVYVLGLQDDENTLRLHDVPQLLIAPMIVVGKWITIDSHASGYKTAFTLDGDWSHLRHVLAESH